MALTVKSAVEGVANAALIVTSSVLVWTFALKPTPAAPGAPLKPPTEAVSLAGAAVEGSPAATVGLLVFSDFQCPYCGKFATDILPIVTEKYVKTGKVRLAFRQMPLDSHQFALPAAKLAQCAGDQGKFWAVHDDLFKNQKTLSTDWLTARSKTYGLDEAALQTCVESPATEDKIRADIAIAQKFDVRGTPTMFVGRLNGTDLTVTRVYGGTQQAGQITTVLDQLLK
jgi:protein-disulfide isomerase